jgi:hypothetical protein
LIPLKAKAESSQYVAIHGGISETDTDDALTFHGNNFGATYGYNFPMLLGLETSYRHTSIKDSDSMITGPSTTSKIKYKLNMDTLSAGARLRFFWILSAVAGMNYYMGRETEEAVGVDKDSSNFSQFGSYFGGGLKIPISNIDIYADYIVNRFKSGSKINNIEFGVRYRFE